MRLGVGRKTKEDKIDYAVGVKLHKKVGMPVKEGDPLVTVYANREDITDVTTMLYENITIGEEIAEPVLVRDIITE